MLCAVLLLSVLSDCLVEFFTPVALANYSSVELSDRSCNTTTVLHVVSDSTMLVLFEYIYTASET